MGVEESPQGLCGVEVLRGLIRFGAAGLPAGPGMAIVRHPGELDRLSTRAGCPTYINQPVRTVEALDGRCRTAIGLGPVVRLRHVRGHITVGGRAREPAERAIAPVAAYGAAGCRNGAVVLSHENDRRDRTLGRGLVSEEGADDRTDR